MYVHATCVRLLQAQPTWAVSAMHSHEDIQAVKLWSLLGCMTLGVAACQAREPFVKCALVWWNPVVAVFDSMRYTIYTLRAFSWD